MVRGQPMHARTSDVYERESRHVQVLGLPSDLADDRLRSLFSPFGRVQKVNRDRDLVVISFTDRLAAMKASAAELRFEGTPLRLSFHEIKSPHAPTPPALDSGSQPSLQFPITGKPESNVRVGGNSTVNTNTSKRPIPTNGTAVEIADRPTGGLQGIQLSGLPTAVPDSTLRLQLNTVLSASRSRSKFIDVSFEHAVESTKALLLVQNISDVNLLLADLNHSTLPSMSAGQRLRARLASHVAVTEAHSSYLAATAGVISATPTASTSGTSTPAEIPPPDPCHKDANRTLYVGNLERRVKEEALRLRFSRFGVVLEVDIKNRDSHSPFAFLQFTDIESVARAIHAFQSTRCGLSGQKLKCKVNWGKPQATAKLWIGGLPRSCSHEFLFSRLRNVAPDGVQEVIYDASNNEALVIFRSVEQAQMVHSKIKTRLCVIPPEKPQKDSQSPTQQVDFASDKLHDFFEDRKFGRIRVSDLINTDDSPPLTPTSTQSAPRKTPQSAAPPDRTSSRASAEKPSRRSSTVSPTTVANAPEGAAATAHPIVSRSESADVAGVENLLAPPPDPPTDLRPSTPESGDPMSSRHTRRSGSRRSSPDTLRRRRSRDHYDDRQRRKSSNSRSGYPSRYRDNKYNDRLTRRHSDVRHRRRSPSSSSGSSTSSVATSSSRTRTTSASSAASVSPKRSTGRSPLVEKPAEDLGHSLGQREFPLDRSKTTSSHAPLVRADAVDCVRPPSSSTRELVSPDVSNPVVRSASRSAKETPNSTTSTPRSLVSASRADLRDDLAIVLPRFRENINRTTSNVLEQTGLPPSDPRRGNEHYATIAKFDDHPHISFPSFFFDEKQGKRYCSRVHTALSPSLSRRTSQPVLPSPRVKAESTDVVRPHPSVSRTTSSGSVESKPADVGLQPLVPNYPPPPLGTSEFQHKRSQQNPPLESTGGEMKSRVDFNAPAKPSFNERLQSITSKVELISGRIPATTSTPAPTFEESLQRIRMKTKTLSRPSCDSTLGSSPPVASPSAEGTKPGARLTISIPSTSSAASTPNVSSPAFLPFPPNLQQPPPAVLSSPAGSLSGVAGRSMSFTQAPPMSIETPPAVVGLAPRSASYAFATSPAASLPLPPQPPQLQTTTIPQSPSILSPKLISVPPPNFSKPPPNLLVSPTPSVGSRLPPTHPTVHPSTPSTLSSQFKPPGLHTNGSKSAVTSPLTATTPSTPKSASSTREEPKGTPPAESAEEARRKKEEKLKLFQSIRVPKKPRDANPGAEVFSFSSPLSRGPPAPVQQTSAAHTPTSTNAVRKPVDKPMLKSVPSTMQLGKSPSIPTPTSNGPAMHEKVVKNRDERTVEKQKPPRLTPVIKSDAAKLAAFIEKEKRKSAAELEEVMSRIKTKAARKFPNEKEQREKYVREKQERLKQKAAVCLRQLEDAKRKQLEQKQVENQKKSAEKQPHQPKSAEKREKHREKERSREENSVEKDRTKIKMASARKRRPRTPSESGSGDESEENSSEILAECGLRNIDLEMQRILFEEAKTGQLNLSMYERVKRKRMTTVQSEEHKKSQALEMLREKNDKKKKPKRVQPSSSDDSDAQSTSKTGGKSSTGARSGSDVDSDVGETSDDGGSISSAAKLKKMAVNAELRKKAEKAAAKAKKSEKGEKSGVRRTKKPKDTTASTEDSETDRTRPQKTLKKSKQPESSADESDDANLVKKLQKNLSNYTGSPADEAEGRRRTKKSKKMSALLADDDFCANSDEDTQGTMKRPTEKNENSRMPTGKLGRSREKSRSTSDSTAFTRKTERGEKPKKSVKNEKPKEIRESKKPEERRTSKTNEKSEARKVMIESTHSLNEVEPRKKKQKLAKVEDAETKKRRRSTDGDGVATIKRAKSAVADETVKAEKSTSPLHVRTASLTVEPPALLPTKMSPHMGDFTFAPISPSPSSTNDSVRLENFVAQNCRSRDETPLISPLAHRFDSSVKEIGLRRSSSLDPQKPNADVQPLPDPTFKRLRTLSSSSSSTNSSSSLSSSTSSGTSSSEEQPGVMYQPTSYEVDELRTFQFVRALDGDAAKTSSVVDLPITTSVDDERPEISKIVNASASPSSGLMDELHSAEDSSTNKPPAAPDSAKPEAPKAAEETEEEDDEVDYEEMLISELNRKEQPTVCDQPPPVAAEETFPPLCSQETEDAVESITAIMANRNVRSDDEEEEIFPLAQIAAHPQAVEYLANHLREVQIQQQQFLQMQQQVHGQLGKLESSLPPNSLANIAGLMGMAGQNASPEFLRLLALQQQQVQRQQQEEVQRQQQEAQRQQQEEAQRQQFMQQRQNEEHQRQLQQRQEEERQHDRLVQLQAIYQQQFLQQRVTQASQPTGGLINSVPTVPPIVPQTSVVVVPRLPVNSVSNVEQSKYQLDKGRYPICWQGNLALKSNGTRVQMHHVSGNHLLIETTANELATPADDGLPTIRITQRMRLQNPHLVTVCNKMNNENEFVALICFPCGQDAEQVSQQTTKMTSTFINYLTSKMAAGVVTRAPNAPHPSCVAHVFPPCEFAVQQLQRLAPEIFDEIDRVRSTYLFVVVTRSDGRPIVEDHVDNSKLPPMVSADTPKYAL